MAAVLLEGLLLPHGNCADRTLLGCWVSLASPIATEVMGLAGFDWLLLDAEHAPNDVLSLIPQLMALKDSPSAPVVRRAASPAGEPMQGPVRGLLSGHHARHGLP